MIEFKNVVKEYADIKALDGVSFAVRDGEFAFIVGHSGAGKTTVTKVLLRQEKVTSGQILVDGIDITKLPERAIPFYRRKIGMVFQDFRLFQDKTAYENVAFAMRVVGTPGKEIKQRVPALLRIVNMEAKAGHRPGELSGGEQQRISIARALLNQPKVIIADEPTGNLDPETASSILQLLKDITATGTAIVMTTHNIPLIDKYPGIVYKCQDGKITDITKDYSHMCLEEE